MAKKCEFITEKGEKYTLYNDKVYKENTGLFSFGSSFIGKADNCKSAATLVELNSNSKIKEIKDK